MKQVPSYQTNDGRLFTDKGEALTHEFTLEMKGFIQVKNHLNRTNAITVGDVATTLTANFPEVYKMMKYHNQRLAALKPKVAKVFAKV